MMLLDLGACGIVQVFDLTKFNDGDLVCIALEEFAGCKDIEADVVG